MRSDRPGPRRCQMTVKVGADESPGRTVGQAENLADGPTGGKERISRRDSGQDTVQVSGPRISFSMSPGPKRRVTSSPCFWIVSSRVGFSTE